MSEKRILIVEVEKPASTPLPTREQAIESIGRALCRKGICSRSSDCPKSCDMWKTEVGDWAEAALNALLEGHDDEK